MNYCLDESPRFCNLNSSFLDRFRNGIYRAGRRAPERDRASEDVDQRSAQRYFEERGSHGVGGQTLASVAHH